MKIVRNTPDQLILRSVPWILSVTIGICILVSVGFGLNGLLTGLLTEAFWGMIGIPAFVAIFIAVFVRRDDLILDRSRDLLEMRHSTVFGRTKVQHQLRHLESAVVQTQPGDAEGGPTHRIALVLSGGMDAGTHPVTPVYVGGNGARRAADAINDWLKHR